MEKQYVDDGFPTDFPVVAPFLADLDTSGGRGHIYYRLTETPSVLNRISQVRLSARPSACLPVCLSVCLSQLYAHILSSSTYEPGGAWRSVQICCRNEIGVCQHDFIYLACRRRRGISLSRSWNLSTISFPSFIHPVIHSPLPPLAITLRCPSVLSLLRPAGGAPRLPRRPLHADARRGRHLGGRGRVPRAEPPAGRPDQPGERSGGVTSTTATLS